MTKKTKQKTQPITETIKVAKCVKCDAPATHTVKTSNVTLLMCTKHTEHYYKRIFMGFDDEAEPTDK